MLAPGILQVEVVDNPLAYHKQPKILIKGTTQGLGHVALLGDYRLSDFALEAKPVRLVCTERRILVESLNEDTEPHNFIAETKLIEAEFLVEKWPRRFQTWQSVLGIPRLVTE